MKTKDILEAGELMNNKELPKTKRTVYVWVESSTEINFVTVDEFHDYWPFKRVKPCKHPGWLSHVTHPCEECGEIAGREVD